MAELIRDERQQKAFQTVTDSLETLKIINKMLLKEDCVFQIVDENVSGPRKPKINVSRDFNGKIQQILIAQKKAIVKQINALAKQYRIALDDIDLQIMSSSIAKEPENPEPDMAENLSASDLF